MQARGAGKGRSALCAPWRAAHSGALQAARLPQRIALLSRWLRLLTFLLMYHASVIIYLYDYTVS